MAELHLQLPYKVVPAKIVFRTMCTIFPLWAIMAPAVLGFVIGRTAIDPQCLPFTLIVELCLASLAFTLGSIGLTAVSEDNRIHVSKDGISFPPFLLPRLRFRRARAWPELMAATIQTGSSGADNDRWLLLTFNDGVSLPLKLSRVDNSDAEQLLLALELWATHCQRTPELIRFQQEVQNQAHGITKLGYTQLWEEELGRRFQSTAFVPLEPDKELQGGRLKIVRQLAFGGLSAIYLAQEQGVDLVVLKEAVVPANADPEARAQAEHHLQREAEVLSHLQHPNIARVLDHFVEDGRDYLMLEYVPGADLRQYVKQTGPADQMTVIGWGLQILDILHALHCQNPPILHRDLTPENLVVTKDTIVLIDFGAANQFVGAATGTVVGKQAYIPAEQLRGKSVVESDLYAFGGTLHFLLTGKDPVPLSVSHPKMLVPDVDSELDAIIARCCAFEPEDRFHSADEIKDALRVLQMSLQDKSQALSGDRR